MKTDVLQLGLACIISSEICRLMDSHRIRDETLAAKAPILIFFIFLAAFIFLKILLTICSKNTLNILKSVYTSVMDILRTM